MNKKFITLGVLSLFTLVLVSAAVVIYFGQVQRDVTVTPSFEFTGDNADDVDAVAGESVTSENLNIESLTEVIIPLSIETTPDDEGFTHTINYLLDADAIVWDVTTGYSELDEEFYDGRNEVTFLTDMTLGDLDTINFQQYVDSGYPVSVNILLDINEDGEFDSLKDLTTGYLTEGEDDVLKIEWAYNGATAGYSDSYMESEDYNTWDFNGVGNIDDTTSAWLYSVKPGGAEIIDGTLTQWKAGINRGTTCWYVDDAWYSETCDDVTIDSDTKVIAIQIENLGWISEGFSVVRNIEINDIEVSEEPTLTPGSELNFNVDTEFSVDIILDTYTIETTVNIRE